MVDIFLNGYEIFKDIIVLFNVWVMYYDENEWDRLFEFDFFCFFDVEGKVICFGMLSYFFFGVGRWVCFVEFFGKI